MNKPVFVFGIILPVVLTAVVVIGCLITFNHYHKKLIRQTHIYNAINSCKQQLQGAEQEARFLDAEISSFKSTKQFDDLISILQSSANSEKGTKWVGSEPSTSETKSFTVEGLSGPTIPIIGDAFKKSPTVLIDSWNIQKHKKEKKLIFSITMALPLTEQSE